VTEVGKTGDKIYI